MAHLDLSTLEWTLSCWRPYSWRLGREEGSPIVPDIGPIPASIPCSVQQALLNAGLIPDYAKGLQSLACEWVEHRHWEFRAMVPAGVCPPGERVFLNAEGLDYSGWVLVDGEEAGTFAGTLMPHRIELPKAFSEDRAHKLSIVFAEPPPEQGQMGYTSASKYYKPRYAYSWDWTPRVVPIGIWDGLSLSSGARCAIRPVHTRALLDEDLRTGSLEIELALDGDLAAPEDVGPVEAILGGAGCCGLVSISGRFEGTRLTLKASGLSIEGWWPNGLGHPKTYVLSISAEVRGQRWCCERTVGFKRVRWLANEGSPADAEPWICEVNKEPVFLQGANWVPPRTCYPDSTEQEYRRLIELYRDMGANVLRVWGGAILEKELFYRLCDEAGILVWQEFPLSSSGVENWPPEDPESIEAVCRIAESYIERRAHHPSLLLWCGGNELTDGGSRGGEVIPCDCTHPCLAALQEVVEREDPGRRFLATSPTGPLFFGEASKYGTGKLHDVHGPWGFMKEHMADMAAWRAYWEGDDALFRSEVGMPGPHDLEPMLRYAGEEGIRNVWPPATDYWRHTAAWWTQWARFEETLGALEAKEALTQYIECGQRDQAEAYAFAAAVCKKRFPQCGGFIIWMGHDAFPCPANNSVIDYDRNPKPAYYALKKVFEG